MRYKLRLVCAFAGLTLQRAAIADQASIINQPAEKYAIAPGGVDMRTGQYVYTHTDLQIGPESGGLALTRTTPVYVAYHANPFGNFSSNWDMMLVERRVGIDPPMESGTDYRMFFHFGGRAFTFEGLETSPGFGYKSDGPTATLTFSGGTKDSASVVYSLRAGDGTLYNFRPMGNNDCTTSWRCAYVSQIVQPDGTVFTLDYAYDSAAAGNRAKLIRVTSSRGYVLMQEWSADRVSKACIINAATAEPPVGSGCPATALATTTYTYDGAGKLIAATAPDNTIAQFSYSTEASTGYTLMGFIKPSASSPWLTNKIFSQLDEEQVPHEVVLEQDFADGRVFSYNWDYSPYTINHTFRTVAGGTIGDAHGHQFVYQYDWPILPGSRERICRIRPCTQMMPDDELKYTYQQTKGPVLIVDELGRETRYDYCEPAVWEGLPSAEWDRCAVNQSYNYFLPEGGTGPVSGSRADNASGRVEISGGNIVKVTRYPKPGSSLPPIVAQESLYGAGTFTQTKPVWRKDANGNQTDYTYDTAHGGVLTETGPAVNINGSMVRPQKRYSYVSRYAWLKSGAGYVQAATPIWLLASESSCRTSAWTGSACAAGANDEVITTYDYGPYSGPNNLLLRSTTISAEGVSRRTCYSYDALGNKVSQTTPRGACS